MKFEKYQQNLRSVTTQKHINYAAKELNLTLIKEEKKSKFKQAGEEAGFDMRGIK